ncbi:MAG: hypothetical protein IT349_20520 [Candidatus Eisenbacteria bacterium]|nr:hypothetical protein [Candidatus Eisenbacteria bacterium]
MHEWAILNNRGQLHLWRGEFEFAGECTEAARNTAANAGWRGKFILATLNCALLKVRQGSFAVPKAHEFLEEAKRDFDAAAELLNQKQRKADDRLALLHQEWLGEFYLARGEYVEAIDVLLRVVHEAIAPFDILTECRVLLAQAYQASGDPRRALQLVDQAIKDIKELAWRGQFYEEARAWRVKGHALLANGCTNEAVRILHRAKEGLSALRERVESSRVNLLLNSASRGVVPSLSELYELPPNLDPLLSRGQHDNQTYMQKLGGQSRGNGGGDAGAPLERSGGILFPDREFVAEVLPSIVTILLGGPAPSGDSGAILRRLGSFPELVRPLLQEQLLLLKGRKFDSLAENRRFVRDLGRILDLLQCRLVCQSRDCGRPAKLSVVEGTTATGSFVFYHTALPGQVGSAALRPNTRHGGGTRLPHLELIMHQDAIHDEHKQEQVNE